MPIKKDPASGKRWVEMEFIASGTPEELWRLMATGPGYTAWFTPTEIDERVGGRLHFDLGAMGSSTGEVTTWQPPLQFGYVESAWAEGAPPLATEITITARSGGRCVVRMVHSLFATNDDWDDQIEGFEGGWPGFIEVLKIYLAHFSGQPAAAASAMQQAGGAHEEAWRHFADALQIAGANVGDPVTLLPLQLPGIVEFVQQDRRQRYVIVRTLEPMPGIAFLGTCEYAGKVNASLVHYCYGAAATANAQAAAPRWREWLERTFVSTD